MVVNIAGFRAYVVADRTITWETRVVVGKEVQQTPVFRDELQYVVFNPTWTVPYSIATREMLPEIKAQPGWFETRDFEVRNRTGDLVDERRLAGRKLAKLRLHFRATGGTEQCAGADQVRFPERARSLFARQASQAIVRLGGARIQPWLHPCRGSAGTRRNSARPVGTASESMLLSRTR